jgi:branched-chain amino acid transport system substrate-binding protein
VLASRLRTTRFSPRGDGTGGSRAIEAAAEIIIWCLAIATPFPRPSGGAKIAKPQKFQQPLTLNSALGYFATMVAVRALDAAKSFKPEDIADALRKVKVGKDEMITSSDYLEFDENGRNKGRDTTVTQFQGDKLVTVWPPQKATAKPVLKGFNTP